MFKDINYHDMKPKHLKIFVEIDLIVDPEEAHSKFGIVPTVCFIREDGYAIATTKQYEGVVFHMDHEWVAFARKDDKCFTPIEYY